MFGISLALATILFAFCWFDKSRAFISRCARAVWVCRVSAVSAGLGIAVFAGAAPARDLFAERNAGTLYWTIFFILVMAWALCVHYAARKAIEQQAWAARDQHLPLESNVRRVFQQEYAFIGAWLPRLLGFLCFVGVGLGISGAAKTSVLLEGSAENVIRLHFFSLQISNVGTAFVYLLFVVFRRIYRTPLKVLLTGDPDAVIAEPSPLWFLRLLASSETPRKRADLFGDWIAVVLVGSVIICFVASTVAPLAFSYAVPRAWFIPVMFGIPVFPLSIMTAFSHRLRFPIFVLLILVLGGLSLLAPGYHDARTMATEGEDTATRQIMLQDALRRWTQSNCPADGSNGPKCAMHPVIVALAGGASRAAFLSVTVLGDILDTVRKNKQFHEFGAQMFAISGVSGGAVGAAVVRSALVDAGSDEKAPCKSTDGRWYGLRSEQAGFFAQGGSLTSWKACLQSITAGDFLSPAILGLAFRDPWGGLIGFARRGGADGDDRAALLERAFEARYARSLAEPVNIFRRLGILMGADQELLNRRGLARPLGYHGDDGRWTPLLLLNATSVDTGRRIIASEVWPSYRDKKGQNVRVFPDAYDLFEVLSRTNKTDIALVTAATLSARFPVISPYGALPNNVPERPSERAVDGGYFENDGVTTALNLALAIKQLLPEVEPVILHVTNDPVQRAGDNVSDGGMPAQHEPPAAKPRVSQWFESVINPVTALFGTRGGHASQAVEAVRSAQGIKYVRFQVFDEAPSEAPGPTGCHLEDPPRESPGSATPIDEVSMSWWLSGAVQEYLDRQLCHPGNRDAWKAMSEWLKK
jgi:hypothetical protein